MLFLMIRHMFRIPEETRFKETHNMDTRIKQDRITDNINVRLHNVMKLLSRCGTCEILILYAYLLFKKDTNFTCNKICTCSFPS